MTKEEIINRLKEGNARFVADNLEGKLQDSGRRDALSTGQQPFTLRRFSEVGLCPIASFLRVSVEKLYFKEAYCGTFIFLNVSATHAISRNLDRYK